MNFPRLRVVQFLFFTASLILAFQLFNIQVLKNRHYKVLADLQHLSERNLSTRRGSIVSEDGFPLAVNKPGYLLFTETSKIKDSTRVAKVLSDILFNQNDYDVEEKKKGLGNLKKTFELNLKGKLESRNHAWLALSHRLSTEIKEKIEEQKLGGIGFEEEPLRFYPEGTLASFVLGFVGSDENGNPKGYYGLEGFYDGDLKGRGGKIIEEKSALGMPILNEGFTEIKSSDGRDLILTLNRSVQFLAERHLKDGVERYKAKSGTVIIMDPWKGSVIAMASYPNFDPGNWEFFARNSSEDIEDRNLIFRNPATSETYEPGSVIKGLTISSAIDMELITPRTQFDDSGPIIASGNVVDNWDRRHHGKQNIIQLLQKSNNMGAAFVGKKVGSTALRDYFTRFGLGFPTGIDLAGEDSGFLKEIGDWREIDLVTAAFGQGVSVTPLQLALSFSAIANGGVLYKPYVVSKIRDGSETTVFKPVKVRQVISPPKAKIMTDLLTAAAEGGEGKFFVLKKYHVAGKTGTAQIPVEGHYDANKSNATFIGFLPNSPRFVMLVRLKEPSTSVYAAETAVPLWMEITRDLVSFYGIAPDR